MDGNAITDLSGIAELDGLVKLSVANNQIERLDFGRTKWWVLRRVGGSIELTWQDLARRAERLQQSNHRSARFGEISTSAYPGSRYAFLPSFGVRVLTNRRQQVEGDRLRLINAHCADITDER